MVCHTRKSSITSPFDFLDKKVGCSLHAPFTRIFVFAHSANVRMIEKFMGGVEDALGNLLCSTGIVFGNVVVRILELVERSLKL